MLIAYARVSTDDQSLALQRADLRAAGCKTIFEEKLSGKTLDRPALAECLASLVPGDTLMVTRVDRLARNMRDLLNIIHELEAKGVGFRAILQPGMDTTSIYSRLVLQIMAAVAEFEVSMTHERMREGIARAQREGKYIRKERQPHREMALKLRREGHGASSIARRMSEAGLPTTVRSVYRLTRGQWSQNNAV